MKTTTRRLFLKRAVVRGVATAGFLLSPSIESVIRLPFARADNREIGKLIQQLGHTDDAIREKAFWKLHGRLNKIGKKIVPALMRGLRDKNERMGRGCATLLGSIGLQLGLDDKQINTIRKLLTKGKKHEQEAALIVMKNYSDIRFLPALLHVTEKPHLGDKVCTIVVVHYTVDQLIDALKHKEKNIRRSAAMALKLGVQRPSIHCPHVTIHPASSNSKAPHYLHSTDVLVFSKAIPGLNKIIKDSNEDASVRVAAVDAKLAIDKEIEKAVAPEVYLVE
jgi:hypothetical protein